MNKTEINSTVKSQEEYDSLLYYTTAIALLPKINAMSNEMSQILTKQFTNFQRKFHKQLMNSKRKVSANRG
jgi:hypothetical protein